MCVKNFQKFDIRSDDRDQVTLVTSFQLSRAELTQNRKYLMADDRQKLKCNKMVTVLLHIMKDTTKHRNEDHHGKDPLHRISGKPGTLHCNFRNPGNPCAGHISGKSMEDHLSGQDSQKDGT